MKNIALDGTPVAYVTRGAINSFQIDPPPFPETSFPSNFHYATIVFSYPARCSAN